MTDETCLETPEGTSLGHLSGSPVIVPGGVPMQLTATGAEKRQGLTLILHDASKPTGHPVHTGRPRAFADKAPRRFPSEFGSPLRLQPPLEAALLTPKGAQKKE
jgi:hypothetical protein